MGWLGELSSSVVIHKLLLRLCLLCQVKCDVDETWYEWCIGKGLQSYRADFEICINYANYTASQKIQTPTINITIHNIYWLFLVWIDIIQFSVDCVKKS